MKNQKTTLYWLLLATAAGHINAGGYLSCHRFVSHVTGFATLVGVESVNQQWSEAFTYLLVPLFFLIGSFFSTIILGLSDPGSYERRKRFHTILALVALILSLTATLGQLNVFGVFGEPIDVGTDFILLSLLCGSCGLINALVTSVSGAVFRITHLTGITTDLGIGLARSEWLMSDRNLKQAERKRNFLRAALIFSFLVGTIIGAVSHFNFEYLAFHLPSLLIVYLIYASYKKGDMSNAP